jgi:aspartate-semialdehyde dehydrogenase
MKIALVGATGLVGQEMLTVLAERSLPVSELIPVASARSVGSEIHFRGRPIRVVSMAEAIERRPDLALFSAGGSVSTEWAPHFVAAGATVIDNSSAWRMDPAVLLLVPEVNGDLLADTAPRIIANPNCSTIQLVVALQPLHAAFGLRRVVVSTYQSVTGTGKAAVDQLMAERRAHHTGQPAPALTAYPHPIDLNVLPQVDVFLPNGYTREEMKMVNETRKIMRLPELRFTATAVRVPTIGGHSEAVNAEFDRPCTVEQVRALLAAAPGVVLADEPAERLYPMPITAHGRDEVFVGRIRLDHSNPNTLNLWVVADNLRKGAATNAVQIAERWASFR